MTHQPEAGEPALPESQPQRTRLAWRRTELALGAAALLGVVLVARREFSVTAVVALAPTLAAIAVGWGVAERRIATLGRQPVAQPAGTLPALALVVAAIAVLGAIMVVIA